MCVCVPQQDMDYAQCLASPQVGCGTHAAGVSVNGDLSVCRWRRRREWN